MFRYELFAEPDVRQTEPEGGVALSAGMRNIQLRVRTARYRYRYLTANYGDCMALPPGIGRPSINETYEAHQLEFP